jgi:hypothetical protein
MATVAAAMANTTAAASMGVAVVSMAAAMAEDIGNFN